MNLARIKLRNYKAAYKIDIPVTYLCIRLNTGPTAYNNQGDDKY
jgi:hypothetical protein